MTSFPKLGRLPKKDRARRQAKATRLEHEAKALVRERDRTCRFPGCGCRTRGFALHVCHAQHKGMGGNPAGDRSKPDRMILLCAARHLANRVSLHAGTLRIVPLTKAGWGGRCQFLVQSSVLQPFGVPDGWYEIGRERRLGQFAAFTPEQTVILDWLATMKV